MRIWALVSTRCDETVELFLDEEKARTALRDVLRDEPNLAGIVSVIRLEWGSLVTEDSLFSPN